MKIGDVVYIAESNRYVRKVQIVRILGDMYLIRWCGSATDRKTLRDPHQSNRHNV